MCVRLFGMSIAEIIVVPTACPALSCQVERRGDRDFPQDTVYNQESKFSLSAVSYTTT